MLTRKQLRVCVPFDVVFPELNLDAIEDLVSGLDRDETLLALGRLNLLVAAAGVDRHQQLLAYGMAVYLDGEERHRVAGFAYAFASREGAEIELFFRAQILELALRVAMNGAVRAAAPYVFEDPGQRRTLVQASSLPASSGTVGSTGPSSEQMSEFVWPPTVVRTKKRDSGCVRSARWGGVGS